MGLKEDNTAHLEYIERLQKQLRESTTKISEEHALRVHAEDRVADLKRVMVAMRDLAFMITTVSTL